MPSKIPTTSGNFKKVKYFFHHNLSRKLKKKLKRKQMKKKFQGRKRKRVVKRRKKRKMRSRQQQNKIKRKSRRLGVSALSRIFSNRNRNTRRRKNRWLGGRDHNETWMFHPWAG